MNSDDYRELIRVQFATMDKKLDAILTQVTATNGRVGKTEDDIIRIQERLSPAAASSVVGVIMAILYGLAEWVRK